MNFFSGSSFAKPILFRRCVYSRPELHGLDHENAEFQPWHGKESGDGRVHAQNSLSNAHVRRSLFGEEKSLQLSGSPSVIILFELRFVC